MPENKGNGSAADPKANGTGTSGSGTTSAGGEPASGAGKPSGTSTAPASSSGSAKDTKPAASQAPPAAGTSDGKQPPTKDKPVAKKPTELTPEQAIERAAVAERNASKKVEQAEARAAAAERERDAAKAEGAKKDEQLAALAKKALLDPDMDEATLLKTIKTLKGKSFNPAAFMEKVALMVPDEEGGEVKDPPAKEPSVKEVVEAAIAERERQAAEAAKKTKEDDDKKKQEDLDKRLNETREAFKTETLEAFSAEKHPLLWASYQASLDLLDEEAAKHTIFSKALAAFQNLWTKGERLTPAESVQFLELQLEAKRARELAAKKTPDQEMDDEFARIDKSWADEKPMRLDTDDKPVKRREDMTVMERAELELDELDRRNAKNNRLF